MLDDLQHGQSLFQLRLNPIEHHITNLQHGHNQGIRQIALRVLLVGLLLGAVLTLQIPFSSTMSAFERVAIRGTAIVAFVSSVLLIIPSVVYTLWQSLRDS